MRCINPKIQYLWPILLVAVAALLFGCGRGNPSKRTPIHLNPNMDNQEKYEAQETSRFFADGSAMRQPVPGTVARGQLHDDEVYYLGTKSDGSPVEKAPVQIDMLLLKRGRERFDIYCSPCHSRVGDGRGIMVNRGYLPPPSFHTERIRNMLDGEIFGVISNGIRNMPAYGRQIDIDDRWAIICYLRALQRSHNASLNDIPEELRSKVTSGQ